MSHIKEKLMREHDHIRKTLDTLEQLIRRQKPQTDFDSVLIRLGRELKTHFESEEAHLVPALLGPKGEELMGRGEADEHRDLEASFKAIKLLLHHGHADQAIWDEALSLMNAIRDHMAWEEECIYPMIDRLERL